VFEDVLQDLDTSGRVRYFRFVHPLLDSGELAAHVLKSGTNVIFDGSLDLSSDEGNHKRLEVAVVGHDQSKVDVEAFSAKREAY